MKQRAACSNVHFGVTPNHFENLELRHFVQESQLLTEWVYHCVPAVRNSFRFGIGCDPKPVSDLDSIYGVDGAIPELVKQRIFVFAEDGSGYPYCLRLDSGEVFRAFSAWGGDNDKVLAEVIDVSWASLTIFADWLKSTLGK